MYENKTITNMFCIPPQRPEMNIYALEEGDEREEIIAE